MGLMYYAGIGVPEEDFPLTDTSYQELIRPEYKKWWKTAYEHSKAFSWWHEAAHQGDTEAQFYLGWMYQNGFGIKKIKNMLTFIIKKPLIKEIQQQRLS